MDRLPVPVPPDGYRGDEVLRSYLRRALPADVHAEIEPGLATLAGRAAAELAPLAQQVEACPPRHLAKNAWGERVDRLDLPPAWGRIRAVAAEEGLVAIPYEAAHGEWARVHQAARVFLFHPWSAMFTCPLGMTDGAAQVLLRYADANLRDHALPRLLSRDPARFWTSAQWMTEWSGGSDLAGAETEAHPDPDGAFRLFGTKSFVSAPESDTAIVLARIAGAPAGSKGLSLFYVEPWGSDGRLAGARIEALKDKMGTRTVATAEVRLEGARGRLVGDPGGGIRKIAAMLNITRLHNAVGAIGFFRRAMLTARAYAGSRTAFGRLLCDQPLHVEVLAEMQVEFEGAFHLAFRVAELAGRDERGLASEGERDLRRVLTAVSKLLTARIAVAGTSEAMECVGGVGYIEDSGFPTLLRDAQVTPIWEGSTNVLALEALRGFSAEAGAFLEHELGALLGAASGLDEERARVAGAARALSEELRRGRESDPEGLQASARGLALTLGRAYAGALLLRHAAWSAERGDPDHPARVAAARRWCRRIPPIVRADSAHRLDSRALSSCGVS